MSYLPSRDPDWTPAERNRLVALMGMFGSAHAGERANAASLADRMVRARGLTWNEVVAGQAVQPWRPPPPPSHTPAGASADIAFCARHPQELDEWPAKFIASLRHQRRPLSPKQIGKLAEIAATLRARGCT